MEERKWEMTERIVEHHVNLVRKIVGDMADSENIATRVRTHYVEKCHPALYPFTDEHPLENYVTATVEIATAIMHNDFEPISNFADLSEERRNFDRLCFNCPNYNPVKEICRLDDDDISAVIMEPVFNV
jgi:hypothetical protein